MRRPLWFAGATATLLRRPFLLPTLWALLLGVFTLPPAYSQPGVGLDPSWLAGLNLGIGRRLHWGHDLVATYGPLGFTNFTAFYAYQTWQIALGVTLLVHGIFFATLAAFLKSIGGTRWRWALMAAVLLIPLTAFPSVEYECTLTALLLLFMAGVTPGNRQAVLLAASSGVALGLLVTIKGTGLVAATALLAAYAAFALLDRRPLRMLPLASSTALSFLALWILAGQPVLEIGAYLRGNYEIVSGYSAAMSLLFDAPLPIHHVTSQVAFGVLTVASAVASLVWALSRRDRALTCLFLLATPLLFLDFKEGYVRFGNRQLVFYSLAALLETMVLLRALRPGPGRWPAFGFLQAGAVALLSALLISGVAAVTGSVPEQAPWPVMTAKDRLTSYGEAAALVSSADRRASLVARTKGAIRDYYRLDPDRLDTAASTDILPWEVEAAYAYPLQWSPRPVLQSYFAYTPYLDQLDAAYFESDKAPAQLLLRYGSVDGRYPPFDEPAAFRAIYAGYQVIGRDHDFLILARRAHAEPPRVQSITSVKAKLGDLIQVPSDPAGGIVYASVRVPYSPRGHLMNILFQPAELHIRFGLDSGETGPYRFIPRSAPDGLMVGSYIANIDDLRQFLGRALDKPMRTIRITADRNADYQGLVEVTFYSS